jgi:hypothetical protein
MRYMYLIYGPAESPDGVDTMGEMQQWMAMTRDMAEAGQLLAGDPLHGVETATTVRVRDGRTVVTDGPFAETKEILGGYYILDCPDLDTALAWAAKFPNVAYGSIEVRPIVELPGM